MSSCLVAFLVAVLLSSKWLSLAQAKIVGDCTFGNVKSWESNETTSPKMKISGQLPSSRNRRHSCVVKTESRKGVLYLRAKKREESKEGEINQFCVLQLLYRTLCIADVPISINLNLHFAASLLCVLYCSCRPFSSPVSNSLRPQNKKTIDAFIPRLSQSEEKMCTNTSRKVLNSKIKQYIEVLRPRVRNYVISVFIYLKRMHEVRRMVATWREIFMNRLSVKLPVSKSVITRALNRVPRIFCDFKAFSNKTTAEVRPFSR